MARWRDVKKGKVQETKPIKQQENEPSVEYASALDRIKAFITDMFMIMMPIMYITTYIIMDGKDSFQASDSAHWITMAVFGAIVVSFWVFKGQTPGFKAYSIKMVSSDTLENISVLKGIWRYLMFLVSAVTLLGSFLIFFRKDKKTFQDIVSKTSIIKIPD
jgi:uncharacterized RDD family membrane protein YckC